MIKIKDLFNIWLSLGFIVLHLLVDLDNKWYLGGLVVLAVMFRLTNKSWKSALFYTYLTSFPLGRSWHIGELLIAASRWGGSWDVPFEYSIRFSDGFLLAVMYLTARSWLIGIKQKKSNPGDREFPVASMVGLLILLGLAGVASSYSSIVDYGLFMWVRFSLLVFLMFATSVITYKNRESLVGISDILGVHTLIISGLIIIQFIHQGPLPLNLQQVAPWMPLGVFATDLPGLYRPGGYFLDPNVASSWIAIWLPLILNRATNVKHRFRNWFYWGILALAYLAIILSGSRFVWLVATLELGLFLTAGKHLVRKWPSIPKHLVWASIAVMIVITPLFFRRLKSFPSAFTVPKQGWDNRIAQLSLSWEMMNLQPWGVGIGMFGPQALLNYPAQRFNFDPSAPHNIWAQVGAELGVAGLAVFGWFVWSLLSFHRRRWQKLKSPLALATLTSVVTFLVLANAYPWLTQEPIANLFFIAAGFVILIN